MAVSNDAERRTVRSDPFAVASDVGGFGLSRDGTLSTVQSKARRLDQWSPLGPGRLRFLDYAAARLRSE